MKATHWLGFLLLSAPVVLAGCGGGTSDRPKAEVPARQAEDGAEIKALACQLPAETGVPLSRWSGTELATEAIGRGIVAAISASTVRRILAEDALKPWQYQSWVFIRDPDFAAKAARILDLYQHRPAPMQIHADKLPTLV